LLAEGELEQLRGLVKRRGAREPLQHLLGTACFCGLELRVTPAVLVPRPETEQLAERAWVWLQALPVRPTRVLDFGTGSGCLALALARHCPTAEVHALDRSPAALAIARENAARHELVERVQFYVSDGFAALPPGLRFHLLVANPPYIPSAEIANLAPEVRDHEPSEALDGGPDGLDCMRRLAREAGPYLLPQGRLMLEFGAGQEEALQALFTRHNWVVERVVEDYAGYARFLVASVGRD
jgi:release factor glutamine methyltransferase